MSLSHVTKGRVMGEAIANMTIGKIWRFTEWIPMQSAYSFIKGLITRSFSRARIS